MDGSGQPGALGLLILFFISIYCALTETALSSVQLSQIKIKAERGDFRAIKAQHILENFDLAVTTLLIITNISHLTMAAIVTVKVTKTFGLSAVSISTAIFTVIVFFACEMLPKSIAKKQSLKISLICSPLLFKLIKIFRPIAVFLTSIAEKLTKKTETETDVSVTEDELQDMIEDMAEEGDISLEEGELISSALEFGNVTAETVLTPRVDIQAINIDDKPEDVLSFIKTQTHSRIPVYQGNIDNIIGVIGIRKYMKAYLKKDKPPKLKVLLDNVYYAHQSKEIHELLSDMSKNRFNLAVITDSYGGTVGIVTIEDILENLVGEIWDESDVIKEAVIPLENDKYIANAECSLDTVFDLIGFEDTDSEIQNSNILLGQWCYEHFNSIPTKNQSFDYKNLHVTIEKIKHNRIISVLLEKRTEETTEQEKQSQENHSRKNQLQEKFEKIVEKNVFHKEIHREKTENKRKDKC